MSEIFEFVAKPNQLNEEFFYMTNVSKMGYITILSMLMALTAPVDGSYYDPSICCQPNSYDSPAEGLGYDYQPSYWGQGLCCSENYNYYQPDCRSNCCNANCGIKFNADLLYWRPELCGLEGAFGDTTIATSVSSSAITTTTVTESDKEPHSKWNTGIRLGAEMATNCLDLELKWTHFDGKAKFREHTQHGHWNINYNVIDLNLGHSFCVASCFHVKPYIGVRGAHIHQKLKSHLETLFTSTLIGDNTVFTDKDDKEDFWGIGPQLGIKANWAIGCNLSLYGNFDVVTYYGDVKRKNFDVDTFTSTVSVCDGKKKHCFSNIGTDAEIGIRWNSSTNFCGCCLSIMIKLGLEQHRIYDFSELGSDGNLSLDGGVFGVGIGFRY